MSRAKDWKDIRADMKEQFIFNTILNDNAYGFLKRYV